jgi:hypothetical protein
MSLEHPGHLIMPLPTPASAADFVAEYGFVVSLESAI